MTTTNSTYGADGMSADQGIPPGAIQDTHLGQDEKVRLRTVVQYMLVSSEDNCDCDTCAGRLDCLAERIANSLPLEPGMEHMQIHLQYCSSCREEFDALVRVIVAQNCGEC